MGNTTAQLSAPFDIEDLVESRYCALSRLLHRLVARRFHTLRPDVQSSHRTCRSGWLGR
jgi:hypothetical protein